MKKYTCVNMILKLGTKIMCPLFVYWQEIFHYFRELYLLNVISLDIAIQKH